MPIRIGAISYLPLRRAVSIIDAMRSSSSGLGFASSSAAITCSGEPSKSVSSMWRRAERLARFGATYVVTCGNRMPPGLDTAERAASLAGQIAAGAVPDWLMPLPMQPGDVFQVYRIVARSQ